jgi:hypothetical protein
LLRPEAVFLPAAVLGGMILLRTEASSRQLRVFVLIGISFVVPLILYLAWKLWYFGFILPNPALVKMPGGGFTRPRGVASISVFLTSHTKIITLAGIGLLVSQRRRRTELTAALMIVAYLLFYLRVDTLMDQHNRFLYPSFPFLLVLALPALKMMVEAIVEWPQVPVVRVAMGVMLFMLVFFQYPSGALSRAAGRGGADGPAEARGINQVSHVLKRIGTELGTYPRIREVTIGSTDAGLVPFFSGARHVDMAGLNTRFIAVHRDVTVAADYFFAQRPDVIIVRAKVGGVLIDYEHGVLGNYPRWAHHAGWDDYTCEGAIHTGPDYDLYFFLRRGDPYREGLQTIVRRLSDPDISPLQTSMGTAHSS